MKSVVIIGSGNLAEALARAVATSDLQLIQLFARNAERAEHIASIVETEWTSDSAQLATADIYILAVSDRVISTLASTLPIPTDAIVAHTAGCVPLEALPAKFTRRAVIYPLQTFTKGREVNLREVPLLIEASNPVLCDEVTAIAQYLSDKVLDVTSTQRAQLHLAAVFACNFANHMYALGERLIHPASLDFELLKPLIRETAAKACEASSPAAVQTGPAVRNDFATKATHLDLLGSDLQLKNIYSTISQSIWETSKKI